MDVALFPVRRLRAQRNLKNFMLNVRTASGIGMFAPQLSSLTGTPLDDVLRYCREAVEVGSRLTDGWRRERGFDVDSVNRAMGEAMYVTARCTQPDRAVETGVWRGVSSAFLLTALHDNGHGRLYSIDLPTFEPTGRVNADRRWDGCFVEGPGSVGDLVSPPLRDRWNLRLGDAKELLPSLLDELGAIDLFFHDSEHSYQHMMFEWGIAWKHLRPGGWLLTDDITWSPQTRRAWAEFTAGAGGTPYRFFGPDGNRGIIQAPLSPKAAPEHIPR